MLNNRKSYINKNTFKNTMRNGLDVDQQQNIVTDYQKTINDVSSDWKKLTKEERRKTKL